jgi:hypothetical protein
LLGASADFLVGNVVWRVHGWLRGADLDREGRRGLRGTRGPAKRKDKASLVKRC